MPSAILPPRTLYDKVFDDHLVDTQPGGTALLYIDRHIVHEVTSPQAFEGLRNAGRKVRRLDCTICTVDHNVPTSNRKNFKNVETFIQEADSRQQCVTLEKNVQDFGLTYFGLNDSRQGIVHIVGPEQGFTLPGTTVVCGDSHTSTHGAFGALAFGIGTSEVEHVLATQTILQRKSKNMKIQVDGPLAEGVNSKDIILHVIGVIGTAGGTGSVLEFCGSTIESLSMEARMSITNMSIEAGARAGMIAPDETTIAYLKGRPLAPTGEEWDRAVAYWRNLKSDPEAHFDKVVQISASDIDPTVSWGTSPQDVVKITGVVPDPKDASDPEKKASIERALKYMGLEAGVKMEDVKVDKVFIGSCTNSRIEDLRSAAKIAAGRKVAPGVYAMIVPGSGLIKAQAEKEGLDRIFKEAGFDWREAGCSMCLGMNPDQLKPGERCASTSNRNFEGRQGPGGRTHLMSPAMAAAAAVTGRLTDVRKLGLGRENVAAAPAVPVSAVDPENPIANAPTNIPADTTSPPDPNDLQSQSEGAPKTSPPSAGSSAAGMPKFETLTGIAAPLDISNVDTDMIISARYLKTIKRTGLGQYLFGNLRFEDGGMGAEKPEFILNKEPWKNSKIMVVTGPNFGCGSSREHAPWALLDFGIRCVIAPSFADIFFNNTFKNGMLPIVLPVEKILPLAEDAKAGKELTIDLPAQVIRRPDGTTVPFEVEDFKKYCLVNGYDDIGLTMQKEDMIKEFETRRSNLWSWLDGKGYKGKIAIPQEQAGEKKKMDW